MRGEEKRDLKERWYRLLLNLHLPVPPAVILPPQTLLPCLPGQLPSLKQSPSFYLWGKFKNTDMGSTYWRLLSWRKAWKEEIHKEKLEAALSSLSPASPLSRTLQVDLFHLHFMLLFLLVSCPPATEHQQGDLNFWSQLYLTEVYKGILATRAASVWKLKQKKSRTLSRKILHDFVRMLQVIYLLLSRL